MHNTARILILAIVLSVIPNLVWSDSASDIQALKDEKALLDAQSARDVAATNATNAASDLAKAKAAAADIANTIQTTQYNAAAALTKSQIGSQTAQIDALKATFGAPPNIGSDGNVTIADASSGTLLQIKAGSLEATWMLADKLCNTLAAANVKDVFFASSDLDAKIQSARMVLREFNALSEKVHLQGNRDLAGLGDDKFAVAPAAALAAVSLLQYGAGALQSMAKLFRSDYAVGLSSDATRAAWLEYFMAAMCPAQIPQAQPEAVVRNQSLDTVFTKLNEMQEFHNTAISKKTAIQKEIDKITAKITELKANKQDPQVWEGQLQIQHNAMKAITPLDAWLPRIPALITAVSTAPGAFLDALTWNEFGDKGSKLKIGSKNRLIVVLTTQDGQVTKTFWLTGKKVYGRSAGELIYRVLTPEGKIVTVGYLTAMTSTGRVKFDDKESKITDDTHHWPMNPAAGPKKE